MFRSSRDYILAARVLEDEKVTGYIELVDDLLLKAAAATKAEEYIRVLGAAFDPQHNWTTNGYRIFAGLIADGWTPPEGLL